MCGIVGYIGNKSVSSVLLVGLERLQYRGYDSAGMAALDGNEIHIRKEAGKLQKMAARLDAQPLYGQLGIGHTRWATHGEPNQLNAHPHTDKDKRFAVVLNGIIENYYTLKEALIKKGCVFTSETDAEVVPHMLAALTSEGKSILEALAELMKQIDGKMAAAIVCESEPDKIFFVRAGAPLLCGIGKRESFLASDLPALLPLTRNVLFIEDDSIGYLDSEQAKVFDFDLTEKPAEFKHIDASVEDSEKGEYPSFMLKEIFEQPNVLRRIIDRRVGGNAITFDELDGAEDVLKQVSRFIIQACGTSWHAGLLGKLHLEDFTRVHTEVDISSEFRYRNPVVEGDTMVIAISQSGETADTLAAIHGAKAKFVKVLSFINNINSTMRQESDMFIELLAGQEIGVASTKAYTAEVLTLTLFASYLAGQKGLWSEDRIAELVGEVRKLPHAMESILEKASIFEDWAKVLSGARDFIFLGRTYNYPTALEGALKLKEISYIHSSGYAGGEFKHGPIALVAKDVPVVCLATEAEIYPKMISNIQEVKSRGGIIVAIVTEGDEQITAMADYVFAIPRCPEILSPILSIVPLQLLSYYIAVERGCDVDRPRNLAKSVTVE